MQNTREDIFEEPAVQRKLEEIKRAVGEKEAVDMLNATLDIFELFVFSSPFMSLLTYLCEQARHAVLYKSLNGVSIEDEFADLIRAVWGAEINSRGSKKKLLQIIAKLPAARFEDYVGRTFHNKGLLDSMEKEDRLVLLEAAEEILRPVAFQLDKGALKRIIDQSDDPSSESQE